MKTKPTENSRKASQRRGEHDSTEPVHQVIKLGVDVHARQYTLARMIDHQGVQPAQKLAPEQFKEFLARQLKLARRVVMVYEAGCFGFALYRQAVEMGVECLVCAPERLSRRKRVNDKIDARELLSRLDRYLSGNTAALRVAHVPTIEQEMRRRKARERNTYRKELQRWRARGRSLLHTLGIMRPGSWWKMEHHQTLMKQIEQRYGPGVLEAARGELDGVLQMLELVQKKRVRALLVELAWLLPRFQPKYRRLKRWKKIFASAGKTMRKKAAVALARQLAVDLWRIKTARADPRELGLKLVA